MGVRRYPITYVCTCCRNCQATGPRPEGSPDARWLCEDCGAVWVEGTKPVHDVGCRQNRETPADRIRRIYRGDDQL